MAKKKSNASRVSCKQSASPSEGFKPFSNYEGRGFEVFLQLLNRNQVAEFECEDFRIQLGSVVQTQVQPLSMYSAPTSTQQPPQQSSLPVASGSATASSVSALDSVSARPSNQKLIRSPFVGTFYTSPAPGKPPYIQVGTKVKPGDTLCIVEAMKLMNEIESEVQGKVVEIIAQNGRPVEYDEPLLVIEIS